MGTLSLHAVEMVGRGKRVHDRENKRERERERERERGRERESFARCERVDRKKEGNEDETNQ